MAPGAPQHPPILSHRTPIRTDSFSRSLEHIYKGPLHKEVLYSPVNMTRKSSSDDTDSPITNNFHRNKSRVYYESHRGIRSPGDHEIPPDGFYPKQTVSPVALTNTDVGRISGVVNSSRSRWMEPKDINIVNTINSGWHSCFKNNNYLFVRNCRGDFASITSDDQDSLYRSYNIAEKKITVISPLYAEGKKLCVALQPEEKDTTGSDKLSTSTTTESSPLMKSPTDETSTPLLNTSVNNTKVRGVQSLPKKFRSNKLLPSSVPFVNDVHKNGVGLTSAKKKATLQKDLTKSSEKKFSYGWFKKLKSPHRNKQEQIKSTDTIDSVNTSLAQMQTPQKTEVQQRLHVEWHNGPHTSTPIKIPVIRIAGPQSAPSTYSSLPYRGRHSGTPWRPEKNKNVRRKLPYTTEAPSPVTKAGDETNFDLLNVSPLQVANESAMDTSGRTSAPPDDMKQIRSCRRRILSSIDGNRSPTEEVSTLGSRIRRWSRSSSSKSEPLLRCANVKRSISEEPLLGTSLSLESKKENTSPQKGSQMEKDENLSLENSQRRRVKQVRRRAPDPPVRSDSIEFKIRERSNGVPVACWLQELRVSTENECLNALQGKVITKDQTLLGALQVGMAQETAEILREHRTSIIYNIYKTRKSLDDPNFVIFCEVAVALCSSIINFLQNHSSLPSDDGVDTKKVTTEDITEICDKIICETKRNENLLQLSEDKKKELLSHLEVLGKNIASFIDGLVLKQLNIIIETLEESKGSNITKRAIFALILLGQLGQSFCELLAKTGAVRALLCVCIESKWRHLHASALRALTVICCVPAAVKNLEQSGGVECIGDVLCDVKAKEKTRSEAAGLIAQITAPWMENSDFILRGIQENGCKLIKALTDLATHTESSEVMLLSSAALANLSFIESAASKWMLQYQTPQILVSACTTNMAAKSLFIKDQVATVLANVANNNPGRETLLSNGCLEVLLKFLHIQPSFARNQHQLTACEQIQQKAAIALARLCTKKDIVNTITNMKGIQRLVQLCKEKKERNNSDSVLVACLATLRKIANFAGKEEFETLGALEFIESRLWDTFLVYSSKQESYV